MKKLGRATALMSVVVMGGFVTLALTGCTEQKTYSEVCMDKQSTLRVDDSKCDSNDATSATASAYAWYFIASGNKIPAISSTSNKGSYTEPEDDDDTKVAIVNGAPSKGGYYSDDDEGYTNSSPEEEEEQNGTNVNEEDEDENSSVSTEEEEEESSISSSSEDE